MDMELIVDNRYISDLEDVLLLKYQDVRKISSLEELVNKIRNDLEVKYNFSFSNMQSQGAVMFSLSLHDILKTFSLAYMSFLYNSYSYYSVKSRHYFGFEPHAFRKFMVTMMHKKHQGTDKAVDEVYNSLRNREDSPEKRIIMLSIVLYSLGLKAQAAIPMSVLFTGEVL